jgi:hypothetical protein
MSFEYRAVPLEIGSIVYEKAQSDSSSITLECENDYDVDSKAYPPKTLAGQRTTRPLWILHAVLLTISTSLFILSHINFTSTLAYVEKYNTWSPAAGSVQFSTVKYNLSTAENRFVGKGRAVDRAWSEISYDMGDQWLSREDAMHLEIPEWHLQVNNPETNETGYRVGVEAFHQLHCLNLLRKVTYREYYETRGGELEKGREAVQKHTGETFCRLLSCPLSNHFARPLHRSAATPNYVQRRHRSVFALHGRRRP